MPMILAITVVVRMRLSHWMTVMVVISANVAVGMAMIKIQVCHAARQLGIFKVMRAVRVVVILAETPAIQHWVALV
jgi:hypothetical protein